MYYDVNDNQTYSKNTNNYENVIYKNNFTVFDKWILRRIIVSSQTTGKVYKLPDDEQSSNIEVTGTELHTTCNKYPHCTTGPSLCGLLALSDKLEIAALLPKDPVNKYMRIS